MFLCRLFFATTALSITLNLSRAAPLAERSQHHSEADASEIEPIAFGHGLPDDISLDSSPFPSTSPEVYEEKKFGLWPTGSTASEKTILLNNGEAKSDATFTLILREGEDLKGMQHRPNDTSIVTSIAEFRERNAGPPVSYSITITHHFRGTVGVVEYDLTIFTTKGSKLRITGIYYVAGLAIYTSIESKHLKLVSGLAFPGLSIESLYSLSLISKSGHIILPLKYQSGGPDVKWGSSTLLDVLKTAQITVISKPPKGEPSLIDYGQGCGVLNKNLSMHRNFSNNWESCDIGFDSSSPSLMLRMHPERQGTAIISIAFPRMKADGHVFRTQIAIKIMNRTFKRPQVILESDTHIELDYYGTESFSLQMKNMAISEHHRDAVSFLIDLPGDRYATADFERSSLAAEIQSISFTVVSPGSENKILQEKLKQSRDLYSNSDEPNTKDRNPTIIEIRQLKQDLNRSSPSEARAEQLRTDMNPFRLPLFTHYGDFSEHLHLLSTKRADGETNEYESQVHAIFPKFDSLVTADTSSSGTVWTSFATEKLAEIEALRIRTDHQNMLVKFLLLRYTISTFSHHKSMQIARSLSKEVSNVLQSNIQPASLVMLKDRGLNAEATYHVLIPGEYTHNIMKLYALKKNVSSSIAKDVLLTDGRMKISEMQRLPVVAKPTNVNMTTSKPPSHYKGVNGTLVAAIVVLLVVIAIPLLTICIGYMLTRRYRGTELSNLSGVSSPHGSNNPHFMENSSTNTAEPASDVLRDNFGRADGENYESFRVRTEMRRQGYYGDEIAAGRQGFGPSSNS